MRVNKEQMEATAQESLRVSWQASWAMLLLGLAGPVGGLIVGYGMARGLSRSVYRLGVRVKDMAQHLDRDVASVQRAAGDDLHTLDRQMQTLVQRVEEVTESVQQHQRDLLRADQLAALGQLAASVAHEVRNPLTAIKMLVEAALRPRNPTPLNAEDLHIIHREVDPPGADRAGVPGLRPAAGAAARPLRPARGRGPGPRPHPARAEQQHVEVVVTMPGSARRRLRGPGAVRHRPGQPAPQRPRRHAARAAGWRSSWRPPKTAGRGSPSGTPGAGIPPEMAGRLFTPFATTKPTGTGLGLSLSSRILKEHGGDVTAGNRPEGGASFVVTLPPAPESSGKWSVASGQPERRLMTRLHPSVFWLTTGHWPLTTAWEERHGDLVSHR